MGQIATYVKISRAALGLLVLLVLLATSPDNITAQEAPDDATCLDCHEGYDATLGAHQINSRMAKTTVRLSCSSCHSGGEVHIEDPSKDNIGNPSTMTTGAVEAVCTPCHQPHMELDNAGFDPHTGQDFTCLSCHSVHRGNSALLLDDQTEFCGDCHVGVSNEFRLRSNHPVMDGNVSCISCHDFTGKQPADYGHGGNARCYTCHPEVSGPYLHEHEAGSSFSTEGGGCTACHQPHGSANERLLKQTGNNLCRQCHGLPAAHVTAHEGVAVAFDCVECHSEVHGSYDNPGLLDPQLGTRIGAGPGSCFCHQVTD